MRLSKYPLRTAIRFAIAGNIIDYGALQEFNLRNARAATGFEYFTTMNGTQIFRKPKMFQKYRY